VTAVNAQVAGGRTESAVLQTGDLNELSSGDTTLAARPGSAWGAVARQAPARGPTVVASGSHSSDDPAEPPTFCFSGGLASPGESTTGRLTRPYDVRIVHGVQIRPHVSTAVVSTLLASPAVPQPQLSLQAGMLPVVHRNPQIAILPIRRGMYLVARGPMSVLGCCSPMGLAIGCRTALCGGAKG
jgi:hypothetical protein